MVGGCLIWNDDPERPVGAKLNAVSSEVSECLDFRASKLRGLTSEICDRNI